MGWLTHLELSWELPAERALYEALAQGCRLVRYDRAGCGLSAASDRPRVVGVRARAAGRGRRDARRAVRPDGHLDGGPGGGGVGGGPSRTPCAAWCSTAAGSAATTCPRRPCGTTSWDWSSRTGGWAPTCSPTSSPPTPTARHAPSLARYQRACSTAATARALLALSYELDVGDLLGRVRAPTLVVHRVDDRAAPVAQARRPRRRHRRGPSWSCCPAGRTSRTRVTGTSWCAWSAGSSACPSPGAAWTG